MQDSPKHKEEKISETVKFLLTQYANQITFLKTISKFSYLHLLGAIHIAFLIKNPQNGNPY